MLYELLTTISCTGAIEQRMSSLHEIRSQTTFLERNFSLYRLAKRASYLWERDQRDGYRVLDASSHEIVTPYQEMSSCQLQAESQGECRVGAVVAAANSANG